MPDYNSVFADASQLSVVHRIQLIEALWDTVPPDSLPPLSVEWLAEIQRRSLEYDSGLVKAVPWEQIRSAALCRTGLTVPDAPR